MYADRRPEEDGEALVAEVREICRQVHHHGRHGVFVAMLVSGLFLLSATVYLYMRPFEAPQGRLPHTELSEAIRKGGLCVWGPASDVK